MMRTTAMMALSLLESSKNVGAQEVMTEHTFRISKEIGNFDDVMLRIKNSIGFGLGRRIVHDCGFGLKEEHLPAHPSTGEEDLAFRMEVRVMSPDDYFRLKNILEQAIEEAKV